ncbi:elongation factor Tu [Nostoc linckia FACHB-104]|nr:elongation factor Tu [Nostoc linckia FACHB-104]
MYDIKAEIHLIPIEAGGRKNPASSGFRPEFRYDNQDWIATFLTDVDVEWVYPGQTVVAYFSFLSPHRHLGKLYPGKEFMLCEGGRIIAKGKVLKILELEQSAKRYLEFD